MATKKKNEKKIVNITKEDTNTKEKYGKDKNNRIVKLEDKGDYKERAKKYRIGAIVLWVLAICFEVIGILRLNNVINWFPNMEVMTFLIICIILDLACFVPGSLLWKKANHIDPISEKDKTRFWLHNNLGTVLSVLAFLPMIIFILTNDELDKKDKTIATVIAVIALLIAGVSSYDFNPVSSEQLDKAEREVEAVGTKNSEGKYVVYWAPHSKKYHVKKDCPAFSQSETVYEGTVRQAFERNLTDPCRRCIPELKEDQEEKDS
ncbi:MAG: hypothetical protein IJI43_00910 [Bacilli bacterium]|nr:hypothetical protein [Bacilli bacterium]